MEQKARRAHVLVIPYPTQGHINPMLQLCKHLHSKGLRTTLAITNFISKSFKTKTDLISIDTISDGYDEGGFSHAESIDAYVSAFEAAGSKSLALLIEKYARSMNPIKCVIYDAVLIWCLTVAKKYGVRGASFFTQACAVNKIYYYLYHGLLKLPITSTHVNIPSLPLLDNDDMPGYVSDSVKYAAYFKCFLYQYSNLDKADFVLLNSYYELEQEAVDSMSSFLSVLTVGPTIPSTYLDNNHQDDKAYGLDLFDDREATASIRWLSTKPPKSIVYVSFGSLTELKEEQMSELLCGLMKSNHDFLWVVRASEQHKLPKDIAKETENKALVVQWCPQLEVLAHEAVGCFVTHCGWNSVLEALSLGVPMVALPQWSDQTTNAKFIADVWKVGVRVKVGDNGLMGREGIEAGIREVMGEGKRGEEMKANATRFSTLAKQAVSRGGSSDNSIEKLVSKLTQPLKDV